MAFLRSLLRCGRGNHGTNASTPLLAVTTLIIPADDSDDDLEEGDCKQEEESKVDESWLEIMPTQEQRLISAVDYLQDIVDSEKNKIRRNRGIVAFTSVIAVGIATFSTGHYRYSKNSFDENLNIFAITNSTISSSTCMEQYGPYYHWIKLWGFSGLTSHEFEENHMPLLDRRKLIGPNSTDVSCYKTFYDIADGPGMFTLYGPLIILVGCVATLSIALCLPCCMDVNCCRKHSPFPEKNYRDDIKRICKENKINLKQFPEAILRNFQSLLNEFQLRRQAIVEMGDGLIAHGFFRDKNLTKLVLEYVDLPDPTQALLQLPLSP